MKQQCLLLRKGCRKDHLQHSGKSCDITAHLSADNGKVIEVKAAVPSAYECGQHCRDTAGCALYAWSTQNSNCALLRDTCDDVVSAPYNQYVVAD